MESKIEYKRCGFNLPTDLVEKLDQYGDKLRVNRTVALTLILQQFFDSQDMAKSLAYLTQLAQSKGMADLAQTAPIPIDPQH